MLGPHMSWIPSTVYHPHPRTVQGEYHPHSDMCTLPTPIHTRHHMTILMIMVPAVGVVAWVAMHHHTEGNPIHHHAGDASCVTGMSCHVLVWTS